MNAIQLRLLGRLLSTALLDDALTGRKPWADTDLRRALDAVEAELDARGLPR